MPCMRTTKIRFVRGRGIFVQLPLECLGEVLRVLPELAHLSNLVLLAEEVHDSGEAALLGYVKGPNVVLWWPCGDGGMGGVSRGAPHRPRKKLGSRGDGGQKEVKDHLVGEGSACATRQELLHCQEVVLHGCDVKRSLSRLPMQGGRQHHQTIFFQMISCECGAGKRRRNLRWIERERCLRRGGGEKGGSSKPHVVPVVQVRLLLDQHHEDVDPVVVL